MAKELLDLVNGHAALQGDGGSGMPENMRRNMDGQRATGNNFGYLDLD